MSSHPETTEAWAERMKRRARPPRAAREDSPAMKAALAAIEESGIRAADEIAAIQARVGVVADRPLFGRYGEGR